jgi:hypothetical protein
MGHYNKEHLECNSNFLAGESVSVSWSFGGLIFVSVGKGRYFIHERIARRMAGFFLGQA